MATSTDNPAGAPLNPPNTRRRPGRQPVSCAECRRLKLRCDRKVPCETCRKRGCAALCPSGTMPSGKTRAVVVADNEGMQLKIDNLTTRIQELERALQDAQRNTSIPDDPMLEDSPTASPGPSSAGNGSDRESQDPYGTLFWGAAGEARFFGPTARSDYLAHAANTDRSFAPIFPNISKTIVDAATFHDTIPTRNADDVRRQLFSFLPTREDAEHLCDLYLECGLHTWDGIPREELYEEVLDSVYNQKWESNPARSAHAISLLYTVFALATLFDTTKSPGAVEAEEYHMLASAAMGLAPPAMYTTLWGIHALLQMTWYLDLSDRDPSHRKASQAWTCLGLAIRLAHGIGLHINPTHWGLDEKTRVRRRRLFWQLFVRDTWMSCAFGRPPLLSPSFIDCALPNNHSNEYQPWLSRYTKLLYNVMVLTFGGSRPSYQHVLQLDTTVRNFPIVPKMDLSDCAGKQEEGPPPPTDVNIIRWLGLSNKESTLLRLHKPYFSQVLADQPGDILKHKYAPSFIAVFRSAWRLIRCVCLTFERVPEFLLRAGFCWSHAVDAAVVMCLVATRVPSSYLAQSAVDELDRVCVCLDEAERLSSLVGKYAVAANNLRKQAKAVLERRKLPAEAVAELDRLSGHTRVVKSKSPAGTPPSGTPPLRSPLQTSNSHTGTSLQESLTGYWAFENLHPTIIEDLKAFETISSNSAQQPRAINFPSSSCSSTTDSIIAATPELPIPIYNIPEQSNPRGEPPQNLPSNRTSSRSSPFEGPAQLVHVHQNAGRPVLYESSGPPALDPSWRSFVEHLGF